MAKHIKHQDSLDVQVRTKFRDEYGNEMEGVIEYDPATGYGKRIKDAKRGLIEDFYRGGGHFEIDGHIFTAENQDQNEIDAVTTLIDAKVARGTPEYEELLKHHIEVNKQKEKDKNKPVTPPDPNPKPKLAITTPVDDKNNHRPKARVSPDKRTYD